MIDIGKTILQNTRGILTHFVDSVWSKKIQFQTLCIWYLLNIFIFYFRFILSECEANLLAISRTV